MIKRITARVDIGCDAKVFESEDIDALISDIDTYLVSKR